jgi:hypothetical protein
VTVAGLGVVAAVLIGGWAVAVVLLWPRLGPLNGAGGTGLGTVDPVDAGAVVVTTALLSMVAGGLTGPVRIVLALAFVTFVPGWALLGLLPQLKLMAADRSSAVVGEAPLIAGTAKVAMAVALSLTLCTLSAQGLLWLRVWNPSALLAVLGGLSLLALGACFVRTSTTFPIPGAR